MFKFLTFLIVFSSSAFSAECYKEMNKDFRYLGLGTLSNPSSSVDKNTLKKNGKEKLTWQWARGQVSYTEEGFPNESKLLNKTITIPHKSNEYSIEYTDLMGDKITKTILYNESCEIQDVYVVNKDIPSSRVHVNNELCSLLKLKKPTDTIGSVNPGLGGNYKDIDPGFKKDPPSEFKGDPGFNKPQESEGDFSSGTDCRGDREKRLCDQFLPDAKLDLHKKLDNSNTPRSSVINY
jgi:hypothetical protein